MTKENNVVFLIGIVYVFLLKKNVLYRCILQPTTHQLLYSPPPGLSLQLNENSEGVVEGESTAMEDKKEPCSEPYCSCQEPDFPHAKLTMLDEKISSPRWVVPVLPEQELEVLMQASINLCKTGQYGIRFILYACYWWSSLTDALKVVTSNFFCRQESNRILPCLAGDEKSHKLFNLFIYTWCHKSWRLKSIKKSCKMALKT